MPPSVSEAVGRVEGASRCGRRRGSQWPLLACAHPVTLDRPAATPALGESFLPSAAGTLMLIIFRLVSYRKHKMRGHKM